HPEASSRFALTWCSKAFAASLYLPRSLRLFASARVMPSLSGSLSYAAVYASTEPSRFPIFS
ncbi:MAG: hypothetical protein PHV39_06605, partial [Methanomicrobium sp.]|nr:hypothetical protein [Methanomicrobium sp.]